MELARARQAAADVVALLAPACRTATIAGSIRRGKAECKDIELVVVAKPLVARPVFGEASSALPPLEALVADLVRTRQLEFDPHLKRNGPKYKRLRVLTSGQWLPIDLFIVDADSFGYQFAIRTGDATFSHQLVTKQSEGGLMPKGYFHHGGQLKHLKRGVIPVPTEAAYFRELGLPPVPPAERNADTAGRLRKAPEVAPGAPRHHPRYGGGWPWRAM
jgi:DNA polymerase/3'-5' exonuclease PolX